MEGVKENHNKEILEYMTKKNVRGVQEGRIDLIK